VPYGDIVFMAKVGELGRFEDLSIANDDFKRTTKVV